MSYVVFSPCGLRRTRCKFMHIEHLENIYILFSARSNQFTLLGWFNRSYYSKLYRNRLQFIQELHYCTWILHFWATNFPEVGKAHWKQCYCTYFYNMRQKAMCHLFSLSHFYIVNYRLPRLQWSVSTAALLHFLCVLTGRELVTGSCGNALWQTHPPVGVMKSSSSSSAPNMFLLLYGFFF